MSTFKPSEKLLYIAKRGINLTFHCPCGDAIGKGDCPRCGRKNETKKQMKKQKSEYLAGFDLNKNYKKRK